MDLLRFNSGTVVSHYGRKENSASACMPPAATAATAAASSLRRKFATVALVNSLLTTLLWYAILLVHVQIAGCGHASLAGQTLTLSLAY